MPIVLAPLKIEICKKFENINGQKENKTNNDLHNTTEKSKYLARVI